MRDRENDCGRREASTQSPCLVHPLSLVEAGRLAGVAGDGHFPFEENGKLSLTQKSPRQGFLLGLFALSLALQVA